MFAERGLDVSVAEIAAEAGVGRGPLFRNFPSKEALVTAVIVERIRESAARGRELLHEPDAGAAVFGLIDEALERQRDDKALFEALSDTWMAHSEVKAAHGELLDALEQLVDRAQAAGAVRPDVGAVDVLLMVKGVCESARAFEHVAPEIGMRQLDLVKAAIAASGTPVPPLRGRPPVAADLDRAATCGSPQVRVADLSLADTADLTA